MNSTAKNIRWLLAACIFWLCTSPTLAADDRFIEGFPDVPYLDIISTIVGEPVIFDTAGGTVAEIGLQFSEPASTAFTLYSRALVGLGWNCNKTEARLRCTREKSLIQLAAPSSNDATNIFILRLEPNQ